MTGPGNIPPFEMGPGQRSGRSAPSQNNPAQGQFDTFLRMLTAQLRNQDPLNPMEGTDFAVQLATFSGVEQQVLTNALLKEMLLASEEGELGQFSDWIGREVRTSKPVWFDGKPLALTVEDVAGADTMTLVTLDENGREVMREKISPDTSEIEWQGIGKDGKPLPSGFYSFRIEATSNGETLKTHDVEAYTRVTGVEITKDGPSLILEGGGTAGIKDVTALRERSETAKS
ncbi:basal-body rod modification protein FlgD [Paracoccus kondratievae]|uniref:Basal-body rod modification protein FlgD n=2 Tax=Paracoccus kondratievae TaxID=135740 RepID=A0AAD3RTU9_9RHOB|nr:basal-body rod modification protein FlgD [Paracoccus kondratievae]